MKHLSSRWARPGELKRRIELSTNYSSLSKTIHYREGRKKKSNNNNKKWILICWETELVRKLRGKRWLPSPPLCGVWLGVFKGPGTHNNEDPLCWPSFLIRFSSVCVVTNEFQELLVKVCLFGNGGFDAAISEGELATHE